MDYSCGKTQLNFVVDPTQNGQMTTILDFHYNTLYITYFRRHLLGGACIMHIVRRAYMHHISVVVDDDKNQNWRRQN